jgi:hypothetical protein
MRWNENTVAFSLITSASFTVDAGSDWYVNPTARGLILVITTGTLTGTPTFRPALQTLRADMSTVLSLWTAAAVISTATTVFYTIYPGGIPGGAETESVDIALPRVWRLWIDYTGTPVSDYCSLAAEAAYLI